MTYNKAEIGRIDTALVSVGFTDGETISQLLSKANLTLSSGEIVNTDKGEQVELNEVAENGETYFIVRNYKNGFA
jgi:hypothetical protein